MKLVGFREDDEWETLRWNKQKSATKNCANGMPPDPDFRIFFRFYVILQNDIKFRIFLVISWPWGIAMGDHALDPTARRSRHKRLGSIGKSLKSWWSHWCDQGWRSASLFGLTTSLRQRLVSHTVIKAFFHCTSSSSTSDRFGVLRGRPPPIISSWIDFSQPINWRVTGWS